jgi:hypothetical protein
MKPKSIVITFVVAASLGSQAALGGSAFVSSYERPETAQRALKEGEKKPEWERFRFTGKDKGLGDAAATPFGDGVEFKLNAVNYNLKLGDEKEVPFQVFFGDFASDESPEKSNETKLLDPTQGIALQFPVAWQYVGNGDGGFCQFKEENDQRPGACILGGDITLRSVRLSETDDAGANQESYAFGGSASLKVSLVFPIFEATNIPGTEQAGKLGIGFGFRYYYHNTDEHNLLFGDVTDPEGNPIELRKGFGAFNAESEFDLFKHFKIRLEYFSPLDNRDVLDDVFKASIVIAPNQ